MKTIVISVFLLSFLPLLCDCRKSEKTNDKRPVTIYAEQATSENEYFQKEFPFISKPFRTSELSFRASGPVVRFEAYAGSRYRQGEVIASIDDRDFRIRHEQALAVYKQTRAEYERIKTLYEKNNTSANTFEKAKATFISAKTAFQTATNELDVRAILITSLNGYPTPHLGYFLRKPSYLPDL